MGELDDEHAWATFTIQVPITDTTWPPKYSQ